MDEISLKKIKALNACKGCDLSEANLEEANLNWENLYDADLEKANLSEVDLSTATLRMLILMEPSSVKH